MVVIGLMPPFGEMTPWGMKLFGVLVGCMFGWLFGYVIPISILALVAAGFLVSGQTVDTMVISLHGTLLLVMVFYAMIFVYGLTKCGMLEFLSSRLLSMKWCTKSPWHVAVALWLATTVCSAICCVPILSMILMFSVYCDMAKRMGAKPYSAYSVIVLVIIAALSTLSACVVPYSSTMLLGLSIMTTAIGDVSYNLPLVSLINGILCGAFFVIVAVVFKVAIQTNLVKVEFDIENAGSLIQAKASFDAKIKWGFFYIVVLFIILTIPSFLPADSMAKAMVTKISMVGVFVVIDFLMSLTSVNGERLLDFEDALKNGAINWSLYFMMGTALVISNLLVTEEAGLAATLKLLVDILFAGNLGVVAICTIFLVGGIILTNCINNVVSMQLMIPVFSTALVMAGFNPALFIGIFSVVLDHGLVLPSGSVAGAFLHGSSEWMTSKQVYLYATISSMLLIIATVFVALPIVFMFA